MFVVTAEFGGGVGLLQREVKGPFFFEVGSFQYSSSKYFHNKASLSQRIPAVDQPLPKQEPFFHANINFNIKRFIKRVRFSLKRYEKQKGKHTTEIKYEKNRKTTRRYSNSCRIADEAFPGGCDWAKQISSFESANLYIRRERRYLSL